MTDHRTYPGVEASQRRAQTRRSLLLTLPSLAMAYALPTLATADAERPKVRVVSLNWAMSETLYAMNIEPVAAAEIAGYERMVGYPPTPPGVIDLGFQNNPNLELLSAIDPDLILIQSWQAAGRPVLERFAPVESFTLYDRGKGDPVEAARGAALRLASLCGNPAAGSEFLSRMDRSFADCAKRLAAKEQRPILLVQALSPTNLVVFTGGSLFDSAMRRIGLRNAWSKPPTLLWGSTQIGVDALAAYSQARIVWIASPDGASSDGLFSSDLWRQLPQVAKGDVHQLPLIWGFGALPTAERFARLLTAALTGSDG
ncbi:MAG: ABC transporter substrate-binding protein [Rhizobium sp.]